MRQLPARIQHEGIHYVIAKIGERKFMDDLVNNGTVYMNQVRYYRRLEEGRQRECRVVGDPSEGSILLYSSENSTLRVTAKLPNGTEMHLSGASVEVNGRILDHAVYCMTILARPASGFSGPVPGLFPVLRGNKITRIERRMRDFGDTMVIFRDTPEFMRRVQKAAVASGHQVEAGAIRYMSIDHCGDMGMFRKLRTYDYQCEYRIGTDVPILRSCLTLNLGSLADIALVVGLDALRDDNSEPIGEVA